MGYVTEGRWRDESAFVPVFPGPGVGWLDGSWMVMVERYEEFVGDIL